MEILTKESFQAAIKKCEENERYKVIVVTKYLQDHDSIRSYFITTEHPVIINSQSLIAFANGSSIRMLSASSGTRGYKGDMVLCAPDVLDEDEYMIYTLQAMEMRNMSFSFED